MALSIESGQELARIKAVLPMSVRVVRLWVPFDLIEERVRHDTTTGRQVDLEWAQIWLEEGRGVGLEDFEIRNDRPIREVALDVLGRLEWI